MEVDTEVQNERLKSMASVDFLAEYYALTFLGSESGIEWATQTHWVGFTKENPPRELRVPRRVYGKFAELWSSLGQPYCVVRDRVDLFIYLQFGGHALVDSDLFEQEFGQFMQPRVSVPVGQAGFQGLTSFDTTAFRRVPTPKLRMEVLKRDNRRCKVCGRRPDDHLDLELHVHHIRPWSKGGVTYPDNLITLCQTCHNGLDPHYDPNLFGYVSGSSNDFDVEKELVAHQRGVALYRNWVRRNP